MAGNISAIVIIGLSVVIGFVFLMVIVMYMRCSFLRVRRPKNGGGSFVEGDYWCIEKKDRETGVVWWITVPWQPKVKIPEPPAEAIEIGKKGKKFVEVYRLSEDEYVYCTDPGLNPDTKISKDDTCLKDAYKPFTPVQRETIVAQHKKANAMKPVDKIQVIMQLAPIAILGLIVVVGMIYWGEIMEANRAAAAEAGDLLGDVKKMGGDFFKEGTDLAKQGGGAIVRTDESPPKE